MSQSKTIMRGWTRTRTTNLEENGARLRKKNLLPSSIAESDDEKHHHESFRHSGRIKSEEVELTMKRI